MSRAQILIALLAVACGDSGESNPGTGGMMTGGAAGMTSAGTGAGGSGGMPSFVPGSATFSAIYAEIIVAKGCSSSSLCHGGPGGGLTLSQPDAAYSALVDVAAMGVTLTPPHCRDSGLKRVVPGAPEQSLLFLKVQGSPPCGQAMPPNPPLLEAANIQRIRDWIMAGALND